jgi:hypothetical protein
LFIVPQFVLTQYPHIPSLIIFALTLFIIALYRPGQGRRGRSFPILHSLVIHIYNHSESLPHSLTPSLRQSLIHSLIDSMTTDSLIPSFIYSVNRIIHSLTFLYSHSLTYSITHSLFTHSPTRLYFENLRLFVYLLISKSAFVENCLDFVENYLEFVLNCLE